jgi:hypothetical protein
VLWTAAAWSAQVEMGAPPIFDHDEVTCMSTLDFPVVEAVVDPVESRVLRKAQVYFKAGNTDAWYFVDMEPAEGTRLRALLPIPLPETDRVDYYVFVLTGSFGTSQTEEISARVSATGCDRSREPVVGSPALTLRATVPNQPPIPPGFQPQGIAGLVTTAGDMVAAGAGAGGGGLSGATVGAIIGGGAAAAVGTAVAVGGSSDGGTAPSASGNEEPVGSSTPSPTSSPPPAPAPAPTPAPPPSVADVSGTWYMRKLIQETCYPPDLGRTSERLMAFQQNGTTLTATFVQTTNVGNFNGAIDPSGRLTLDGRIIDNEGATSDFHMEGSTNGSDMSGTYRQVYVGGDCVVSGTFSGTKTSALRTRW